MPNATFIGFTGTPIEKADHNTRKVFGTHIDVYDIEQAVEDGTTVKIYYESRLAKLELKPEARPLLDQNLKKSLRAKKLRAKNTLKANGQDLKKS